MSDIVLFKLISGEEIVGTVVSASTNSFELTDVVTLAYHPNGDGKMSVGFAPHMPYAEGNVTLYTSAIAIRSDVQEDMVNEYKRIFGGIILPKQGLVGI